MTYLPFILASTSACIAAFALTMTVRRARRIRGDLDARIAERRAEIDRDYQQAREHLTMLNTHLARAARTGRGEPVQVTTEDWAAAQKKARDALLGFLSPEQRNDYMLRQYFDVKGSSGAVYRLWSTSYVGNIEVLINDQGYSYEELPHLTGTSRYGPRFCVHLARYGTDFPIDDHLLAQALMLKTNETELLAIAHRYN